MKQVEIPDEVVIMITDAECSCVCNLEEVKSKEVKKQVFDTPEIRLKTVELRGYEKICPRCGKVHKVAFLHDATQPVQYGKNLRSLVAYLVNYQYIPLERTAELVSELTGQQMSEGTITNICEELYENLAETETAIRELILSSEVVYFDETGARSEGKTVWIHSASTDKLTSYEIDKKHGKEAMDKMGILPKFQGTAVHDHWASYYGYACMHAECNSHILRALFGQIESESVKWAAEMVSVLLTIKERVDGLNSEGVSELTKAEQTRNKTEYDKIIDSGIKEDTLKNADLVSEKTGKPKESSGKLLLNRLRDYDIETLSFMYDVHIPFDNNLAERDITCELKLLMKKRHNKKNQSGKIKQI